MRRRQFFPKLLVALCAHLRRADALDISATVGFNFSMAARPTWKGFLKISLVNIPVEVFPATESSGTLLFNQLHGDCRTRIQQKRWCPRCGKA